VATWADLYPDVLVYVPGCPDPFLAQELRRAATEFFQDSRAWVEWLDPIVSDGTQREYTLILPTDSAVVGIERATSSGAPVEILSFKAQEKNPATFENERPGIVTADRVSITLTRTFTAGAQIEVQACLAPSRASNTLPDALMEQYADAIVAGARYRLMRTPGPLNNPQGAQLALKEYEQHLGKFTFQAYRGNAPSVPRARPKWC